MKKLLKIVLIGFVGLLVLVISVLGYFGFVPGVSALMGTNKPRNLGVPHTEADLAQAQATLGQSFVEPQAGGDPYTQLKASQGSVVDGVITQQGYAAHLEKVHPIADVQVKLEGSTIEMSGRIVRSRIPVFVRTLGVTGASDAEILEVVNKYYPADPIFYFKGTGSVQNNDASIELSRAEIGRFPVSAQQASGLVEAYLELIFDHIPSLQVQDSGVRDGQVYFKGTATKEVPKY